MNFLWAGARFAAVAPAENLALIVVGFGSVTGWARGVIEVSLRNGNSAAAPPLATYALLLRPYPTSGWIVSVAARAASTQLVTFATPSGRDAWDVSAYLSALGSFSSSARYYWTEHEHWYLAVTDAANHADQLISDVRRTVWARDRGDRGRPARGVQRASSSPFCSGADPRIAIPASGMVNAA